MQTTGISSLNLPREPLSAIICGQTGCGKTQFVLDELLHPDHGYYRDVFEVIFILCPTCERNCTYLERPWLHAKRFVFINPGEGLHDCLRALFSVVADTPTLYLIDDMAASKALTKRKTCCPSWPSAGATRSSRFGCWSKSISRSVKTSVNRQNGWPYSTAKIATRLQMRLTRTTSCHASFTLRFARV